MECVEGIWETIYVKSKSFFDREEWESRSFSSSAHFQESSSQVLEIKKEVSSLEKFLTQEESLKKCEEQKYEKEFLLDLCKQKIKGPQPRGPSAKCVANCQNGEWKISLSYKVVHPLYEKEEKAKGAL